MVSGLDQAGDSPGFMTSTTSLMLALAEPCSSTPDSCPVIPGPPAPVTEASGHKPGAEVAAMVVWRDRLLPRSRAILCKARLHIVEWLHECCMVAGCQTLQSVGKVGLRAQLGEYQWLGKSCT